MWQIALPGTARVPEADGLISCGRFGRLFTLFIHREDKERIKLIINVEGQKKFDPGYDIVTRGIFYCARMLSAQKDTEFVWELQSPGTREMNCTGYWTPCCHPI